MRISTPRAIVVLVTVAGWLMLAGCGKSSHHAAPSTSPPSPGTSTVGTDTAASTTTRSTVPPTTKAGAVSTTCQPSQLHMVELGSSGAAGTIELTFSLTNSSARLCTMRGYPGMVLLDTHGAALPTNVVRGGGLGFENVPATDVSLAPGGIAYFNLGYNDVVTEATACAQSSQVRITPPNATVSALVPVATSIQACNGGTIHLSAVFASTNTSATQTTAPS